MAVLFQISSREEGEGDSRSLKLRCQLIRSPGSAGFGTFDDNCRVSLIGPLPGDVSLDATVVIEPDGWRDEAIEARVVGRLPDPGVYRVRVRLPRERQHAEPLGEPESLNAIAIGAGDFGFPTALTVTPARPGGEFRISAEPANFQLEAGLHGPVRVRLGDREVPLDVRFEGGDVVGRVPSADVFRDSFGGQVPPGDFELLFGPSPLRGVLRVLPMDLLAGALGGEFEVRVTGFEVTRQSYDDSLNRDGWHDEVYLTRQGVTIDVLSGGLSALPWDERTSRTPVFGENPDAFPGRVRPRETGRDPDDPGLKTGDVVELDPPFTLWRGRLEQGTKAVLLAPMVVESDIEGSHQRPQDLNFLSQLPAAIATGLVARIAQEEAIGRLPDVPLPFVSPEALASNAAALALGPISIDRPNTPGDRLIGATRVDETQFWEPQLILLTSTAAHLQTRDTGSHRWTMRFTDAGSWMDADYVLFLELVAHSRDERRAESPLPATPVRTPFALPPVDGGALGSEVTNIVAMRDDALTRVRGDALTRMRVPG